MNMGRRRTVGVVGCPCRDWLWDGDLGEFVEGHHPACIVAQQINDEIERGDQILTYIGRTMWATAIALFVFLVFKLITWG